MDQLTSVVFRDVSAQLSTLYLESGRPSQVVGADGSRLQIFYDVVTADHLKGTVSYSPAGGDAQVFPFDVDLHKTAQEIRDQVHELTGLQISNEAPPSDAGVTSKPAAESASTAPGAKTTRDRALIIIVPIILVATGFMIDLVFSQLLGVILDSVTLILRGAILLMLAPFILLGDLLRFALDLPLVTFQYNPDVNLIGGVIVEIPRPQLF